jgi:hypothetical protein
MLEDIRCDVWSKIGGEMIDLGRALMGIIHVALNARAARDGRTIFASASGVHGGRNHGVHPTSLQLLF